MYALTIVDYLKCSHSLRGNFGPARELHISTFDVELTFSSPSLNDDGVVLDFDLAQKGLWRALEPLRFQNLDVVPEVEGLNTTTENLCKYLHDCMRRSLAGSFTGRLCVRLHEGRTASASYEAEM
ncbi:MAG: 6-carboxytetrahydropterin synthase [Planctomycetota bacterium]